VVLKKVSLFSRSRNEYYDAVVMANEKFLMDEVDAIWERLQAQDVETINEEYGPFRILITPRRKK
jgi:hypothetical protein